MTTTSPTPTERALAILIDEDAFLEPEWSSRGGACKPRRDSALALAADILDLFAATPRLVLVADALNKLAHGTPLRFADGTVGEVVNNRGLISVIHRGVAVSALTTEGLFPAVILVESTAVIPPVDVFGALTTEFHLESNAGHGAVDNARECGECKRIAGVYATVTSGDQKRTVLNIDSVAQKISEHGMDLDQTACYVGSCFCGWRGSEAEFYVHVAEAIVNSTIPINEYFSAPLSDEEWSGIAAAVEEFLPNHHLVPNRAYGIVGGAIHHVIAMRAGSPFTDILGPPLNVIEWDAVYSALEYCFRDNKTSRKKGLGFVKDAVEHILRNRAVDEASAVVVTPEKIETAVAAARHVFGWGAIQQALPNFDDDWFNSVLNALMKNGFRGAGMKVTREDDEDIS